MKCSLRIAHSLIALIVCLAVLSAEPNSTTTAQGDTLKSASLVATMVLTSAPSQGPDFVLNVWNKAESIHTTLMADTIVQGMCIHCNKPMKFEAGQSSVRCSACPCGASFAECLIGKGLKKTTWREMLEALPQGTGLRAEFGNPDKPELGVKLLTVDLRSALLPLDKPISLSDAELLAIVKPLHVRTVERADGDRMLRLTLNDDWTTDRAHRLVKIMSEHGITLQFPPAATPKS